MTSTLKPREVKKLWVSALRSGEYRQGRGYLKRETDGQVNHCCLGVLCELYKKYQDPDFPETPASTDGAANFDGMLCSLPGLVRTWVGDIDESLLISLNDRLTDDCTGRTHANSFQAIADVIEQTMTKEEDEPEVQPVA